MIPLRALVTAKTVVGPQLITRYNNLRAVNINGSAAPGRSSGEALAAMERASQKVLPAGYAFEWTGAALQQQQAAGQTLTILGIAVAFAYLFLVVLYESLASRSQFCSRSRLRSWARWSRSSSVASAATSSLRSASSF